jgi:hypothetical protein
MRSNTFGDVILKRMLSRTCAKPVGTLTVRLLGEQKMTDDHATDAFTYYGVIPPNMVYWSTPIAKDDPWCEVPNNDWEMKVDFHD